MPKSENLTLQLSNSEKFVKLNILRTDFNCVNINLPEKIMNSKDLPKCPVETTLKMTGCKWKVLIIKELLNGTMRFCEIKKALGSITQKVLTSNLREMEEAGLIIRKVYEQTPPKVEYSLTDVGYSLRPVIEVLRSWGKDYKKYIKLLEKMN